MVERDYTAPPDLVSLLMADVVLHEDPMGQIEEVIKNHRGAPYESDAKLTSGIAKSLLKYIESQ